MCRMAVAGHAASINEHLGSTSNCLTWGRVKGFSLQSFFSEAGIPAAGCRDSTRSEVTVVMALKMEFITVLVATNLLVISDEPSGPTGPMPAT